MDWQRNFLQITILYTIPEHNGKTVKGHSFRSSSSAFAISATYTVNEVKQSVMLPSGHSLINFD